MTENDDNGIARDVDKKTSILGGIAVLILFLIALIGACAIGYLIANH